MESNTSNGTRPTIESEENRRQNESINSGDEKNQKALEIVMLKQKLRERIYQFKELNSKLKGDSPTTAMTSAIIPCVPRENGSGDCGGVLVMVQDNQECFEVNIEEMPEDMDELLELGNTSLRLFENDPELNTSLSESIGHWMAENGDQVVAQISTGTRITGQLTVGTVGGYLSSALIKKFGKSVLCSIFGGIVLLKIAHRKGYVNIDWNKIFHIDQAQMPQVEIVEGERVRNGNNDDFKAEVWVANKMDSFRNWIRRNSYLAIGFGTGFALKSFSK